MDLAPGVLSGGRPSQNSCVALAVGHIGWLAHGVRAVDLLLLLLPLERRWVGARGAAVHGKGLLLLLLLQGGVHLHLLLEPALHHGRRCLADHPGGGCHRSLPSRHAHRPALHPLLPKVQHGGPLLLLWLLLLLKLGLPIDHSVALPGDLRRALAPAAQEVLQPLSPGLAAACAWTEHPASHGLKPCLERAEVAVLLLSARPQYEEAVKKNGNCQLLPQPLFPPPFQWRRQRCSGGTVECLKTVQDSKKMQETPKTLLFRPYLGAGDPIEGLLQFLDEIRQLLLELRPQLCRGLPFSEKLKSVAMSAKQRNKKSFISKIQNLAIKRSRENNGKIKSKRLFCSAAGGSDAHLCDDLLPLLVVVMRLPRPPVVTSGLLGLCLPSSLHLLLLLHCSHLLLLRLLLHLLHTRLGERLHGSTHLRLLQHSPGLPSARSKLLLLEGLLLHLLLGLDLHLLSSLLLLLLLLLLLPRHGSSLDPQLALGVHHG